MLNTDRGARIDQSILQRAVARIKNRKTEKFGLVLIAPRSKKMGRIETRGAAEVPRTPVLLLLEQFTPWIRSAKKSSKDADPKGTEVYDLSHSV